MAAEDHLIFDLKKIKIPVFPFWILMQSFRLFGNGGQRVIQLFKLFDFQTLKEYALKGAG